MFWDSSRLLRLIGFLCLLLAQPLHATILSSALLNEAQQLAEIEPSQAKQAAKNYLLQRELIERQENGSPSAMSREETDRSIRTPSSTIEAHKIIAQADYAMGNIRSAINNLDEAERLAKEYQLPYMNLDVQLMRNQMIWMYDKNYAAAEQKLDQIEKQIEEANPVLQRTDSVRYRLVMQRALLAANSGDSVNAERLYAKAKTMLEDNRSDLTLIDYHTAVGEFYLNNKKYNLALSELLYGYWQSIESDSGARLAKVNRLLARLFQERRVYDKAIEYLSQAADFYDSYPSSPILADVLEQMGDIYFYQGKFNLALVHYFNVLDHDSTSKNINRIIKIRLSLAATYLQLYNYALAEQYLDRSKDLLEYADLPQLEAKAALLKSGLAYHQNDSKDVIVNAKRALDLIEKAPEDTGFIKQQSYRLLGLGYEQAGEYQLSLQAYKKYISLVRLEQKQLNQISEDAFRQQKEFAEQSIHYVGQADKLAQVEMEHRKFQKISFALFITVLVMFLFIMRRGVINQRQTAEIEKLRNDLFTHSRSRLRNLRMLNVKLSRSLKKSSDTFEQWQMGELIHEPLNDRLRFVMIDLPFLRSMYVQHGYKAGLELERAFGEFLAERIQKPTRLYHFSDANLLYIEPNANRDASAEATFDKFQGWVDEFAAQHNVNRIIRMGISDYPFLPRAYTAINDEELLDLLLLATHIAREVSLKDKHSHWVFLKAIDNAPAASFATGDIRTACQHAINQGLIKIHSSYKNEDDIKKILKNG
ncbi:tetratricopeptide repeat protein [Vibrio harveyi]|uniref:tetratricopeptide repeat protein n=1 Tax=Vibrio harveyi TaxID=669 RepID=UPI0012AD4449|nr:tetratricopeptide repeat protein [Vibrio harveyi]EKO3861997.1 tetratricopeptide repeat protein [Vibrio harveyi]EMB9231085.1 tetratricopeptide repeat protein [Vibrio harveyi]MCQ9075912.1 tetratricopeptide repeat protein [Vibrio harveyi]MDF6016021.1 tetratricopeptide repeat protein [Vibrio harveyi]HDM8190517.1 tetratricopeptide repeat protein [Vibrio harveyi]